MKHRKLRSVELQNRYVALRTFKKITLHNKPEYVRDWCLVRIGDVSACGSTAWGKDEDNENIAFDVADIVRVF